MEERTGRARRLYDEGLALRAQGRADEARTRFLAALGEDPAHADAMNEIARIHHERGEFAEARRWFGRATEARPDYYFGHYNLGILSRDEGDDVAARTHFDRALSIRPDDPDSLNEIGRILWRAGDAPGAERLFRRAAEANPAEWRPLYNLGNLSFERGEFAAAMEWFDRALLARPDDPDTLNDLGRCRFERGEIPAALALFRRAARGRPDHPHARHNAGLCLRRLGDDRAAREEFERAVEAAPGHAGALNELGNLARGRGDLQAARAFFERAIAAEPESHLPRNNLGLVHYDLRDFPAARLMFREAIERAPGFAPAHNNLGLCDLEENRFPEARTHLRRALKLDPAYDAAVYNLGLTFLKEGDLAAATDAFRRADALNPKSPFPPYGLGQADVAAGDPASAAARFREALARDPRFALAREELAKLGEPLPPEPPQEPPQDPARERDGEGDGREEGAPRARADGAAAGEPSLLERIGRDVTALARAGKLAECVGREREIGQIVEVLFRRFKNNPLLVGPPGTGKTAIVEGLAARIAAGEVPESLRSKRIVELAVGGLVAGTTYRGQFEAKVERILAEAKADPDIILFLDEFHTAVGAGRTEGGALDFAQMFKPALSRGEVSCIGATTTEEYRRYIEKDAALERRFHPVRVEELGAAETAEILRRGLPKARAHYRVEVAEDLCDLAVELSGRHIRKRYFPDKAIDLLEKTLARVALAGRTAVAPADLKAVVGEYAGIDFLENDPSAADTLRNLARNLKRDVIGQDEAVDRVCAVLSVSRRRLDLRPERPDGVFLFTGPTGVGKTHFAKSLARRLFGVDDKFIRLDMSEFSEPHAVAKLVGAPPGYVGHDEDPPLTSRVEEHPASVLLLDEVEKAHPDALRVFLQIFDEGRVTDSKGRRIWFSDTTVVMTSNALSKERGAMGFDAAPPGAPLPDATRRALETHFPREWLNRIDEVILFRPLPRDAVRRILLEHVAERAKERFAREGVSLLFAEPLLSAVIDAGYDPDTGARNLERAFERIVLSPLAARLLAGDARGKTFACGFAAGRLALEERP